MSLRSVCKDGVCCAVAALFCCCCLFLMSFQWLTHITPGYDSQRSVGAFDHWFVPCLRPMDYEFGTVRRHSSSALHYITLTPACMTTGLNGADDPKVKEMLIPTLDGQLPDKAAQCFWYPDPRTFEATFSAFTHTDDVTSVTKVTGKKLLRLLAEVSSPSSKHASSHSY